MILLQNKINAILNIFLKNKAQVQNLKKKAKGIDFTIPPALRCLFLSYKSCALCTYLQMIAQLAYISKLGYYVENSLPKINKACFNIFLKTERLL